MAQKSVTEKIFGGSVACRPVCSSMHLFVDRSLDRSDLQTSLHCLPDPPQERQLDAILILSPKSNYLAACLHPVVENSKCAPIESRHQVLPGGWQLRMQGASQVEAKEARYVGLPIQVPGGACPGSQPGELLQAGVEGHGSSVEVGYSLTELLKAVHF